MSVLRVDDIPLLTGAGAYVGDVNRPGQVWARIVRSEIAHGRLLRVDVEAARRSAGVVGVFSGSDTPDVRIPLRLEWAATEATRAALQPPLARDRVRYVGEPVAVIVATSQYAAEDAAELVVVEIEELPPLVETRAAAENAHTVLHQTVGGNIVNRLVFGYGDAEAATRSAAVVIRERMDIHRHTGVPLETRGLVAEYEPESGRLTVWGPTKVKHFNRSALSGLLDIDEGRIRYVETDVGGGFGVRGEFYPEDFVIPWLAIRLERPVKWIEDRHEHFVATNHSREQSHDIELAVAEDGRFLALRDRNWIDLGAYVRTHGLTLPVSTALHMSGPYAWQALEIDSSAVMTNKTPSGTYRGPGIVEATFVRERLIDRAAAELGLDPAELRRRNMVPVEALPQRIELGHGVVRFLDSGDFPDAWDTFLEQAGYDDLCAERDAARVRGEHVGVGLAAYVEHGAVGPYEQARIVPEPGGHFAVSVGVSGVGQGVRTVLAQVAAQELGVPLEDVTVSHHDTDTIPGGFGAFASRGTVFGGSAIMLAARDLHKRAAAAAASQLGVPADEVTIEGARASAKGRSVPLLELGCAGEGRFEKATTEASFGASLALVALDPGTGKIDVRRFIVAYDVGRAVNPELVIGQLVGAAAQGIAGALMEELPFDETGQPLCTSFVDYLMPTAADLPYIDALILEYPALGNPLGARGAGEGGIDGTGGSIANAVADALGAAGVEVRALPLRPEDVKRLIRLAAGE
ncbi:MAG: xanthine dehydrogenase family protein molybdopterin-binding subunit [Thermoleophilia bacterium]|nr:xanthine dehydrogenase family protein molybdopterin-binding subunit [Thermoleophilia bacterium]